MQVQYQLWRHTNTTSSLPLSSIFYRHEAIAAAAARHRHNTALSAATLSFSFNRNPNLTSRRYRLDTVTCSVDVGGNATVDDYDDGDTRNDTGEEGNEEEDGVETEIEKMGKNRRRIRSKVVVKASLQSVWKVLTDYERLADFIPGLAVCQLLEKEPNFARLLQIGEQDLAFGLKFNAKVVIDCYEKDLEDLPTGQRRDIEFKMVEGDFKKFEGKWSIEQCKTGGDQELDSSLDEPFHTTLSYIVDVEPKLWLPVRLIEGRLCKEIKINLQSVRDEAQKVQEAVVELASFLQDFHQSEYLKTPLNLAHFIVRFILNKVKVKLLLRMESVARSNTLKYECLLFDMDDTLYPLSSGVNLACRKNIEEYMLHHLNIEESEVPKMCLDLYREYGTTMAGLKELGYEFDNDKFHEYVHGRLPYEVLKPDPLLRNLLLSMPQRKIIFTNGDKAHAIRVLSKLGLGDCFEGIICFETLNPSLEDNATILCKPSLKAMEAAIQIANLDPNKTIFFDDSARNIASGKQAGLHTVVVGSSTLVAGADHALRSIHNIREALPHIWEEEGDLPQKIIQSNAAELTIVQA